MSRGNRANNRGRSKSGPPFVQLFHYMLDSEAYRALKPAERAVLTELARRFNGHNNGFIALSARDAAERCNVNKDTATRAFGRLAELGFIERTQEGAFSYKMRHAAEWRLTWLPCHRTNAKPAPKAFTEWRQNSEARSDFRGQSVRDEGTERELLAQTVPPRRTNSRAVAR